MGAFFWLGVCKYYPFVYLATLAKDLFGSRGESLLSSVVKQSVRRVGSSEREGKKVCQTHNKRAYKGSSTRALFHPPRCGRRLSGEQSLSNLLANRKLCRPSELKTRLKGVTLRILRRDGSRTFDRFPPQGSIARLVRSSEEIDVSRRASPGNQSVSTLNLIS